MRSHFRPESVGKSNMRSHFISSAAIACAVTGATAMMTEVSSAQIAADFATDPVYAGGWTAGLNGGYGFGAWSFTGTGGGSGQEMSSASSIGTAWTMFNTSSSSGISDTGRAISEAGGLQAGQTFEAVIQNPTTYHFYRGWDVGFLNATDNNLGGNNSASLFLNVFNYNYPSYNGVVPNWSVTDNGGGTTSTISPGTSAAVKIDLMLTSATTYSLTLTPLGGGSPYTQSGTLAGPINYVNFRSYNGVSAGPSDVANNYGISYMEIVPEPATLALVGLGFGGVLFLRRRK